MTIGTVETQRLVLTPIRVEDADEMSRVLDDPDLHTFTGGAPETAAQLAVRYARWVAGASKPGQTWVNLVVRERASRAALGYVQATVNPSSTDLAWVLGTRWQGRGYATEALRALIDALARELAVRDLRALIRADHAASRRLATRLGLTPTDEEVGGEQVWIGSARPA